MLFKQKQPKGDFTVQMLPHNRKEVFFDAVKLHWRNFIGYGLLILLFSLPCLISVIAEDVITMKLMESYDTAQPQEQANILAQICTVKNTRAALDVISYAVLSIGLSGIIRVVRQHAWGEIVFFGTEFKKGIKQNHRQMLLVGLVFGTVNLLYVNTYNMYVLMTDRTLALMAILSIDILILLVVPTLAYAIVSIAVYEKKFLSHLLTALALTAKSPFKTLLAIICCAVPFSVQFIPITYCHIFGRVMSSILMPFVMLAWMLFAFNRFDELINKERYPELVGKGTYPLENDEINDISDSTDNGEA